MVFFLCYNKAVITFEATEKSMTIHLEATHTEQCFPVSDALY